MTPAVTAAQHNRPPSFRPAAARLAAVLVILLAAGLRLHRLEAQSLWNDEGLSVTMIHRSPEAILANTAADIHPPGYYLLLKGWAALTGETEFALRALSALESILTVALVVALGRRLYGPGAGLSAGLLLAVHTFAIYYAQETRMYAQLGLLAAASLWALALWLTGDAAARDQARDRVGIGPLAALTLINAAGLYTQYAYPFTMLAQGIGFLLWFGHQLAQPARLRASWRRSLRILALYAAANLVTLLLFAPWAAEAIRQVTTWPNSGAGTDPATVGSVLVYGWTARGGIGWPAALGAILFAAAGVWAGWNRPLRLLPVLWTLLPGGAFLLLRLPPDDMKQLVPAVAAAALWLGAGAAALWQDRRLIARVLAGVGTAIMAATLLGGLPPLYRDPALARDDYRAMAAQITADPRPGDAIILDAPGQGEVWSYYYKDDAPVYPLPWGGDDATRAALDTILRERQRIFVLFWGDAEQDPGRLVESALGAGAYEADSQWYGRVRLVTYATAQEVADGPAEPADTPAGALNVRFGDHITLRGYTLGRAVVQPGDMLTLTLFWETDAPLDVRYKVFVHLYAAPGDPPLAQHDGEPGGGQARTTTWTPGVIVVDRHGVLLPPDLPAGTYTLGVGLYDERDPAARLPTAQGERLPLAAVQVLDAP